MRRRDAIVLLGTVAVWPLAAHAQQRDLPVVGFLNPRSPEQAEYVVSAFRQGLKEAGYTEGQNVAVEYRWAQNQYARLPDLAADLVRRRVSVIVAGATNSARAAMAATRTVPIVFTTAVDPVRLGLVSGLSRPGGNVTGSTFYSSILVAKQIELLHEMAPKPAAIGMLVNPNGVTAAPSSSDAEAAVRTIGQRLHVVRASSEHELSEAFAALAQLRVGALVIAVDPFFDSRPDLVASLAARLGVPTIYYAGEFVRAGGLFSYGASLTDAYRQAGVYAGRILHGAHPGELPVLQPTKFELLINMKTAKALGIAVPPSILARADEVIE